MPKVSVIIPVYNTEKYLRECLNSIVKQTLRDIEIICVDDGSTDNSLRILKEYEKKDARIKIIALKENIRQGGARNRALDIAKGEFIMFVDSDDYLELTAIEDLLLVYNTDNPDVVVANVSNFSETTEYDEICNNFENYYKKLKKDTGIYPFNGDFLSYRSGPVAKLFKKGIIDKFSIRFPEKLINEDEAFHWNYFSHVNNVYFLNKTIYNRQIHQNSTMVKREIKKEYSLDIVYILEIILNNLCEQKKINEYRTQFMKLYISQKNCVFQRCKSDENELKKAKKMFKKLERKHYILDGYNNRFERIFSVKNIPFGNNKWYKTLTVLGIKLKIRNKKKEK